VTDQAIDVEPDVRQKVSLAEDERVARAKDVRVFQGLVHALGDRDDDDARVFAQVEERRTHEIANVLDENERPRWGVELSKPMADLLGVQVAPRSRVQLHGANANRAQAYCVDVALRIAFDRADDEVAAQRVDGGLEERGLA
jgi:hypothetical protein